MHVARTPEEVEECKAIVAPLLVEALKRIETVDKGVYCMVGTLAHHTFFSLNVSATMFTCVKFMRSTLSIHCRRHQFYL